MSRDLRDVMIDLKIWARHNWLAAVVGVGAIVLIVLAAMEVWSVGIWLGLPLLVLAIVMAFSSAIIPWVLRWRLLVVTAIVCVCSIYLVWPMPFATKTAVRVTEVELVDEKPVGEPEVVMEAPLASLRLALAKPFLAKPEPKKEVQNVKRGKQTVRIERTIDYIASTMQFGLDLKGGSELRYRVHTGNVADPEKDIRDTIEILRRRINISGLTEPRLVSDAHGRILVQVPGAENFEEVKRIIETVGNLEFRFVCRDSDVLLAWRSSKKKGEAKVPAGYHVYPHEYEVEGITKVEELLVEDEVQIDGRYIDRAGVNSDEMGRPAVSLDFDSAGRRRFGQITSKNVESSLAIILDTRRDQKGDIVEEFEDDEGFLRKVSLGKLCSAPRIKTAIYGAGQITGDFTKAEAQSLSTVLRTGRLPTTLKLEQEHTVGPGLGSDSIRQGATSIGVGLIAVAFFMVFYYFSVRGLVADLALMLNLIVLAGILAALRATLTLPGIAGIILTVGMAVDANVLIYERIREWLDRTDSGDRGQVGVVWKGVDTGYERTTVTLWDANFTTFITGFILLLIGTGPIRGFGVTLCLGLVTSFVTALFVSRRIFRLLRRLFENPSAAPGEISNFRKTFTSPWLYRAITGLLEKKLAGYEGKSTFRRLARGAILVSVLLVVLSCVLVGLRGRDSLGIDFTGGTQLHMSFLEQRDIEEVRRRLLTEFPDAQVQSLWATTGEALVLTKSDMFELRTQDENVTAVQKKVTGLFDKELITNTSTRKRFPLVAQIGGAVAQDMKWKAAAALVLAGVAIILYIGWRFKQFGFGIAAVVALMHDVILTLGAFAVTGKQIGLPIIAALLTIVGYSLNDTIVIFDRMRDILGRASRKAYASGARKSRAGDTSMIDLELIGETLKQTLSRTLLTSFTTLLVVLSLFIWGGPVIHDFAFALLVGVAVGTYSSIFVASPVLLGGRRFFGFLTEPFTARPKEAKARA